MSDLLSDLNTEHYNKGAVCALLSNTKIFGPNIDHVEIIETHISHVFIGGDRVFKLKRRVSYPYLDFSTVELRKQYCEAELKINKRTAPGIYRTVIPITINENGKLALDGDGIPVDWVVEMSRFDQETLFEKLVQKGELRRPEMEDLADEIADFHESAEIILNAGGYDGVKSTLDGIAESFSRFGESVLDPAKTESLNSLMSERAERIRELLESRRIEGCVRHCHGDLHLNNICRFDGKPTLFDAIEFNDQIAEIDVLYDLAFLLMDLQTKGHQRLAAIILNHYMDRSGDGSVLAVLPLFLAMRAAIRSHIFATRVSLLEPGDSTKDALQKEACAYLDTALGQLNTPQPSLIAVGGLSGSGKSRLAREIASYVGPSPGARVVRTDVVRKRISRTPFREKLGPAGYTDEMNKLTYQKFYEEITASLKAGHSAVADGVFAREEERLKVEELAREHGVSFIGFWVSVSQEVREQRVLERKRNVSDVTVEIAREQLDYELGTLTWNPIDSSGARENTLKSALKLL